jgi:hypothetical protein
MISYLILSGIIDTSPDLCGEDRSISTLITSGFTSSGIFTDNSRTVYYKFIEEANVAHTIKLQTLSTNCNDISINFDKCKSNRRKGTMKLQCNFRTVIDGNGSSGSVNLIKGIQNIECLQTNQVLSFVYISNSSDTTTPGGCQWSLQYNKN